MHSLLWFYFSKKRVNTLTSEPLLIRWTAVKGSPLSRLASINWWILNFFVTAHIQTTSNTNKSYIEVNEMCFDFVWNFLRRLNNSADFCDCLPVIKISSASLYVRVKFSPTSTQRKPGRLLFKSACGTM